MLQVIFVIEFQFQFNSVRNNAIEIKLVWTSALNICKFRLLNNFEP